MRWPNDWKIKDCLLLCGGLVLTQVLLTVLSAAGLEIPVMRQVVGFVFLTFVPGILLLRILRVHDINAVESMVYSVGLSLALTMFSGAIINFLLPLLGIAQPISQIPILLALAVENTLLMTAAWYRDRDYQNNSEQRQPRTVMDTNALLFLLAILLLMIAGIKVSDLTGNNWELIASLLAMALTAALASFKRFITPGVYPAALFIIGLGLLYQTSLMSPYLVGSDIYTEYQYYRTIIDSGLWNYSIPVSLNTCLSIVMLAPSYTYMTGIDGIWIFKAVYPLLFSFVPLIMFRFMRIQIGALPAFLAVFFFMAVPTYSLEMISLCRQQVAEVFFSLVILLLVDRRIGGIPRVFMMVTFALSIILSHYSLSFITLIYFTLLIPSVLLLKSSFFIRAWSWITSWSGGLPEEYKQPGAGALPLILVIIPVVAYYVLGLAWYLLIGQGVNFATLSLLWTSQSESVVSSTAMSQDLLVQAALGIDFLNVSWQGQLFRILQYITQLFVIVGCLRLLLMPKGLKFRMEYIAVSVVSAAILAACIKLPSFAAAFNTTRWYHVLLITLAPFFIIGGETLLQMIRYVWHRIRKSPDTMLNESPAYLKIITLAVAVPYFIITSGVLYEVTGMMNTARIEAPFSIALSSHRLDLTGNFSVQDEYAARWLGSSSSRYAQVYSDVNTWKILLRNGFPGFNPAITPATRPDNGDLLFLTAWNVSHKELTFFLGYPGLRRHIPLSGFVNDDENNPWKERIYDNGSTEILKSHP